MSTPDSNTPPPAAPTESEAATPAGKVYPKKNKPTTKAERREIQEKQRAAKLAAGGRGGGGGGGGGGTGGGGGGGGKGKKGGKPQGAAETASGSREEPAPGLTPASTTQSSHGKRPLRDPKLVQLFAHLGPYADPSAETAGSSSARAKDMHPAIVALGLKYAANTIRGANARCLAMLIAFKQVVSEYTTPSGKVLRWDLDKKLKAVFQFLTDCRQHSISMGNAFKFVRSTIFNLDQEMGDGDAKAHVCGEIENFIRDRITVAGKVITDLAVAKISEGDVVLTYGRSHVVEQLLCEAKGQGKSFHVVVVDSRPELEGRGLLAKLTQAGIPCTYVFVNALSYAMANVTKVFMGAAAIMANGAVLSRIGTAIVAMTATSQNVPVIFCCETYKLCERVQLDSIVSNELGNPEMLASSSIRSIQPLSDWKQTPGLKLLNLRYDLTPMKYVGMVITEVGMIPATAVPALLREYRREDGMTQLLE